MDHQQDLTIYFSSTLTHHEPTTVMPSSLAARLPSHERVRLCHPAAMREYKSRIKKPTGFKSSTTLRYYRLEAHGRVDRTRATSL
jgi:hypothetical protein